MEKRQKEEREGERKERFIPITCASESIWRIWNCEMWKVQYMEVGDGTRNIREKAIRYNREFSARTFTCIWDLLFYNNCIPNLQHSKCTWYYYSHLATKCPANNIIVGTEPIHFDAFNTVLNIDKGIQVSFFDFNNFWYVKQKCIQKKIFNWRSKRDICFTDSVDLHDLWCRYILK